MSWQDDWDWNWKAAFEYAAGFNIGDVSLVTASQEGENDGAEWVIIGQLSDGRWFTLASSSGRISASLSPSLPQKTLVLRDSARNFRDFRANRGF